MKGDIKWRIAANYNRGESCENAQESAVHNGRIAISRSCISRISVPLFSFPALLRPKETYETRRSDGDVESFISFALYAAPGKWTDDIHDAARAIHGWSGKGSKGGRGEKYVPFLSRRFLQ